MRTRVGPVPSDSLPPDARPARGFRLQPTPTGVVLVVLLVLFLLVAPEVTDPSVAGFVWAAGLGALVVGVVWPCVVVAVLLVSDLSGSAVSGSAGAVLAGDSLVGSGPAASGRVGEQRRIGVHVRPRLSEVALRWLDAPEADAVPVGAGGAVDVAVPLTPVRRGRFERLALVVRCDAPFGLWTASRIVVVAPSRPLVVGPAVLDAHELADLPVGATGDVATTAVGHGGDTTRSVRPYVTGDPAHLVHWPTTARTGTIVVREMEPPADRAVAVVVDLGPGPVVPLPSGAELPLMPTTALSDAERPGEDAVAKAATIVDVLRRGGVRVLLATAEPAPQSVEVGSDVDVDTRLAVATPGAPGTVPPGWPVLHVGISAPSGVDGSAVDGGSAIGGSSAGGGSSATGGATSAGAAGERRG